MKSRFSTIDLRAVLAELNARYGGAGEQARARRPGSGRPRAGPGIPTVVPVPRGLVGPGGRPRSRCPRGAPGDACLRAAVPGRWFVGVLPGRPESPSERLGSPELPSFNPKEREQCHSVVVRRPVLNLALPQLWELCRIFVGLGHSRPT